MWKKNKFNGNENKMVGKVVADYRIIMVANINEIRGWSI